MQEPRHVTTLSIAILIRFSKGLGRLRMGVGRASNRGRVIYLYSIIYRGVDKKVKVWYNTSGNND